MGALSLAILLAGAAAAAEPSPSTAPARGEGPVFGGPLRLRLLFDERGRARGELGFSMRWATEDIPRLPGYAAGLALNPLRTTGRAAREALSGADVGVYSLHLKASSVLPVGLLLAPLSAAADLPAARGASGGGAAGAPPPTRRQRLSLTPARAEIERSLKRDLRRALITAGFDLAVPVNQKVPFSQKQALYESVLKAGDALEEELEALP